MKKTLIALAAVAATSAAFAQSSVTLYGVADAAIGQTGANSGAYATGTATSADTRFLSSSPLNNGTSRWGVRGVEDLGGGMKAGFNFEQGLSLASGASNGTFDRAAYITLGGGFGEVRLGRSLNPSFFALAAWELTGTANYGAVGNQFGNVTGGTRNNSQIAYTTPSFGGVTATLGYVMKGDDASSTVAGQQSKVDLNVIYRGGPLVVALGYNKLGNTPAGALATVTDANVHVGANYNFGGFKLAGSIIDPAGPNKGFSIGGSTMVGPVSLVLDIVRDTELKDTDVLVEVKYPLSKRTFAYVAVLSNGDDKASVTRRASQGVAFVKNNYSIGIRHNF